MLFFHNSVTIRASIFLKDQVQPAELELYAFGGKSESIVHTLVIQRNNACAINKT